MSDTESTGAPLPHLDNPDHEHPRRGSYVILLALSLTVILGVAAFAIDVPFVRAASVEAQYASDAGAHAAMVALRQGATLEEAGAAARRMVTDQWVAGSKVDPDDITITFGGWDYDTRTFSTGAAFANAARVEVETFRPPILGSVFGAAFSTNRIGGTSTAAFRNREMIVVQDVTGSFKQEIGLARDADLTLLDAINSFGFPADSLGMVTFTGDATHFSPLQYVESDYEGIRSQWSTLDWCQKTEEEVGEHAYDPSRDHMMPCSAGGDGTNQASGIDLAVNTLLNDGDPDALRVVLLLSDGKAQCIPSTTACDGGRFAKGRAAATAAEAEGVHIFTVSYNEHHDGVQTAYLEDLTTGMGVFYETPDASELPGILDDIARTIPVALVH